MWLLIIVRINFCSKRENLIDRVNFVRYRTHFILPASRSIFWASVRLALRDTSA